MTTSLITRLEEAAEGCHLLDRELWAALEFDGRSSPADAPKYTTSIDEALALAQRVLPGLYMWNVEFDDEPTGTPASARVYAKTDGRGAAPTPALALCIAILEATTPNAGERG